MDPLENSIRKTQAINVGIPQNSTEKDMKQLQHLKHTTQGGS